MVLSYTTPKRERRPVSVQFEIDGETFIATQPKDSVAALVLAAAADQADLSDVLHATWSWANAALTAEDKHKLNARIRNPDDDFEVTDLLLIAVDILKEMQAAVEKRDRQGPAVKAARPVAAAGVKRRGRPPGSKNKTKPAEAGTVVIPARRAGRALPA